MGHRHTHRQVVMTVAVAAVTAFLTASVVEGLARLRALSFPLMNVPVIRTEPTVQPGQEIAVPGTSTNNEDFIPGGVTIPEDQLGVNSLIWGDFLIPEQDWSPSTDGQGFDAGIPEQGSAPSASSWFTPEERGMTEPQHTSAPSFGELYNVSSDPIRDMIMQGMQAAQGILNNVLFPGAPNGVPVPEDHSGDFPSMENPLVPEVTHPASDDFPGMDDLHGSPTDTVTFPTMEDFKPIHYEEINPDFPTMDDVGIPSNTVGIPVFPTEGDHTAIDVPFDAGKTSPTSVTDEGDMNMPQFDTGEKVFSPVDVSAPEDQTPVLDTVLENLKNWATYIPIIGPMFSW